MAFYITPSGVRKLASTIVDAETKCSEKVYRLHDGMVNILTNFWASENANAFSMEAGSSLRSMYDAVCSATHMIDQRVSDVIALYNQQEGNYCPPLQVNIVPYTESALDTGTPKTLPDGESFGVAEGYTIDMVFEQLSSNLTHITDAYKTYLEELVASIRNAAAFDSETTSYIEETARNCKDTLDTELESAKEAGKARADAEAASRTSTHSAMSN